MAKQAKRTKKFIKNNLTDTIKSRRDRSKKKAVIERSKQAKAIRSGRAPSSSKRSDRADQDEDVPRTSKKSDQRVMGVEEFLGGGFKQGLNADEDEEAAGSMDSDEQGEDEEVEEDDDDLEDLEDGAEDEELDEVAHAKQIQALAKSDPTFYKYLQENDQDLLEFGGAGMTGAGVEDDDDEEADSEDERVTAKFKGKSKAASDDGGPVVVTPALLRSWQKSMIQQHSLRALRRLLLAFRAAAHMSEPDSEEQASAYIVTSAKAFNKIILTALKYMPMVLAHHAPYKEVPLANGAGHKYKLPTGNKKFSQLQKPIQSFFINVHKLLKTLTDHDTLYAVVTDSSKTIPWLLSNPKATREHLKHLFDLWTSSADRVRIAAFLSIRQIAAASNDKMLDFCLRGTYQSFVRSTRNTTIHTLGSINLMKNSATELFALDQSAGYQHAFGFIRQLAIHLRGALKTRSQESYKAVLNWQYLHCLDFWSLILAAACDTQQGKGDEMQPLIYPLVQVTSGVLKLIPTSRYFPMRLHLVNSMLRLCRRTGVYIPLAPPLLEVFDAAEFHRKDKPSTLLPLNFEVTLRAPQGYVRTRVFADAIADETCAVLLEYLATQSRSIAFPELVIPIRTQLRRTLKGCRSPKLSSNLKNILHKMTLNSQWIEKKRRNVDFAPKDRRQVLSFLKNETQESPLESAARLQRKVREQQKQLLQTSEMAQADGNEDEDEEIEDESEDEDEEEEMEVD
ncbi:Noc2-domain-containing protein [Ceraceosorus guamensis]|uniref:Noc2-domain-containing protein n=1 Tax=Ceraceosorus guamensis TaxID=1522189 RepID=A0A316W7G4_9BASI|nr:Noc2-domain-containing protein [Ceraceosorus guamensis]PWN45068.1 Noc2-domain-containing protein [Ceraceosorus guamensis]